MIQNEKLIKPVSKEDALMIGEEIGIDWNEFDINEFLIGLGIELEHGDHDPQTNVSDSDAIVTGKIALAHLKEFKDYYTRLEKLEKEADDFWGK